MNPAGDSPDTPARNHPDNLCRSCGRCCYEKIVINAEVFATEIPCRHLDVTTNLCSVYRDRFKVNPLCLPVDEAIRRRVFPADCPYVQDVEGYRPPRPEVLSRRVVAMLNAGQIREMEDLLEAARAFPPEKTDEP